MEEEMRLGNRDKGWNDPPSFAYDKVSQANTTPRKNLLNQRVAMPQNYMSPSTTGSPHSTPPPAANQPPPAGPPPSTGPPPTTGPPPSTGSSPGVGPTRAIRDATLPGKPTLTDSGDGQEVSCEATITLFRKVFEQCQDKLQKRVISDFERRLKLLQDSWKNNKLSAPVQRRTAKLASELLARNYDSAHEIHLSLMVDHVGEVSQWMVGIKRLIHEARTILPFEKVEAVDNSVSSGGDGPRTVEHESRPVPVPTAKGDAESSVENPGPEEKDCKEESRTVSNVEDAAREVENLDVSQS